MEFCTLCDNIMHLDYSEDKKLCLKCNTCCNTRECSEDYSPEIFQHRYNTNKNQGNYGTFINKYTKFDPTLPRDENIQCQFCNKKNVIYVRYEEMKYIYLCCSCDKAWVQSENERIEVKYD